MYMHGFDTELIAGYYRSKRKINYKEDMKMQSEQLSTTNA